MHGLRDSRISLLFLGILTASILVQGNLDQLRLGLLNIASDTVDAEVTVNSGAIPTWLNGTFIRHACGVFGEIGTTSKVINKINALFDCIEMGQSFRIENGDAMFYNRFYDTTVNDIWKYYHQNMNESSVYWYTAYAQYNKTAVEYWQQNLSSTEKVSSVPHVTWWQIGNNVMAKSENHNDGVWIDIQNVVSLGPYPFRDPFLGYPPTTLFPSEPAHEQMEPNGTLWHSTQVCTFTSDITLQCRHAVYTVENESRTVVGESPYLAVNLSLCADGGRYPDIHSRLEYFHSFAMTENYIILPTTSYLFDICGYFNIPNSSLPFFPQAFEWVPERNSSLYVMRKSDGVFVAIIPTEPMFPVHQLNSFEQDGKIYVDLTYAANSSVYDVDTYVDRYLTGILSEIYIDRFTIDVANWTLESQKPLRHINPGPSEFPNINYQQYNGRPYTYAYLLNLYQGTTAIIKLNVNTGNELWYNLTDGQFAQEPVFVCHPNSTAEDDGVILSQGYDTNIMKAFLIILDAMTMTPLAQLTAPEYTLLGIHNKFFQGDVGLAPAPADLAGMVSGSAEMTGVTSSSAEMTEMTGMPTGSAEMTEMANGSAEIAGMTSASAEVTGMANGSAEVTGIASASREVSGMASAPGGTGGVATPSPAGVAEQSTPQPPSPQTMISEVTPSIEASSSEAMWGNNTVNSGRKLLSNFGALGITGMLVTIFLVLKF